MDNQQIILKYIKYGLSDEITKDMVIKAINNSNSKELNEIHYLFLSDFYNPDNNVFTEFK